MEPAVFEKALAYAKPVYEFALTWLLSPAAWSQFVILLFAYFLAVILTRKFNPVIAALLAPADEATGPIAKARRFVLRFMPLILPLLAYALTGIGESVTRSVFGSGAVIAFGKRVFLFLAIRTFARTMLHDPMLKFLGKFVLIPVGALYALGLIEFGPHSSKQPLSRLATCPLTFYGWFSLSLSAALFFGLDVGPTTNLQALSASRRKCAPPPVNWRAKQPRS